MPLRLRIDADQMAARLRDSKNGVVDSKRIIALMSRSLLGIASSSILRGRPSTARGIGDHRLVRATKLAHRFAAARLLETRGIASAGVLCA